ncbi:hypothetical protein RND71_020477 [Anisodus tanguticus]|nr:hypothetical protein RND71_020477 [Anisodus tanguticus]
MLFHRGSGGESSGDNASPDHTSGESHSPAKGKELVGSHKLKDLFVSENSRPEFSPESDGAGGGSIESAVRGIGVRQMRPLSATFRQRLLRRVWRPMLVSIPE